MKQSGIKVGDKIKFKDEVLQYDIKAFNGRYAICTRKLHRRHDADLLHHKVSMNAYASFTEAYNALKDNAVYTIIDFKNVVRSSDDSVFGVYDYSVQQDIDECLESLKLGNTSLSKRAMIKLEIEKVHRFLYT